MKKILNIAWKDLVVTSRDPSALLLMLVTPFALTLAMAFAFGGFGDRGAGGTGLSDIPLVVVNHDQGVLGDVFLEVLDSEDLVDLLEPVVVSGEAEAWSAVDADEAAAAVIIPTDLTARAVPSGLGLQDKPDKAEKCVIEVYANPTSPISVGVVRSIVEEFLNRVSAGSASVDVSINQLITTGRLVPGQAATLAPEIAQRARQELADAGLINIWSETAVEEGGFDWLAYMAPSMAILFLMFTVTGGGRSILTERDQGTLPRMLTAPNTAAQVLAGKVVGTYLTGLVQMTILILASQIIFDVRWGAPVGVLVLLFTLVAAATGWGIAIAAYARSSAQANVIGTAVTLVFGIGAGHFFPRELLPPWLRTLSFISPNAWGLEAFFELGAGGGLADILLPIAALTAMAGVAFGVAVMLFRRQVAQ